MNGSTIMELAMAKRTQQGLRLIWMKDDGECFTRYPLDDADRLRLIEVGERCGLELIDDASWHRRAR